jgi:hypothetical protein
MTHEPATSGVGGAQVRSAIALFLSVQRRAAYTSHSGNVLIALFLRIPDWDYQFQNARDAHVGQSQSQQGLAPNIIMMLHVVTRTCGAFYRIGTLPFGPGPRRLELRAQIAPTEKWWPIIKAANIKAE